MNRLKPKNKRFELLITMVAVSAFIIIGVSSGVMLNKCLDENVSRRAASELSKLNKTPLL